ncbi:unnamed protein product, partial [marine sediment metagenome]
LLDRIGSFFFDQDFIWIYEILRRAIKYRVPIIFDCRFLNTLRWIYKLTTNIQNEFLNNNFTQDYVSSRLKIIIAHIGFLLGEDDFLFKVLSHPCIYGDLTGQFSSRTKNLIENLRQKVKCPFPDV